MAEEPRRFAELQEIRWLLPWLPCGLSSREVQLVTRPTNMDPTSGFPEGSLQVPSGPCFGDAVNVQG